MLLTLSLRFGVEFLASIMPFRFLDLTWLRRIFAVRFRSTSTPASGPV